MRIAVCIPTVRNVPVQFLKSFTKQLLINSKKYDMIPIFIDSLPIDLARNELARKAIEVKSDYVWWLDSDMIPEDDTLEKLIKSEKDIVGALCYTRNPPYKPVLRKLEKIGSAYNFEFVDTVEKNKLVETDATGFGCLLMKTDVLKKISEKSSPLFEFSEMITPSGTKYLSEDILFCIKAKEFGYKIFVNTNTVCGHIGEIIVDK